MLAQYHKWDIASLENLIVFERDIYVSLLEAALNKNNTTSTAASLTPEEIALIKKAGESNKAKLTNDSIRKNS